MYVSSQYYTQAMVLHLFARLAFLEGQFAQVLNLLVYQYKF